MTKQSTITISTRCRGFTDITADISNFVHQSNITSGLCNIFIQHTSASLLINENADPSVRVDLQMMIDRLAPDADPKYTHTAEGDDDMSAHIRAMLTATSLNVPVAEGHLLLGTWQGIYLWEHRYAAQNRKIILTILGI